MPGYSTLKSPMATRRTPRHLLGRVSRDDTNLPQRIKGPTCLEARNLIEEDMNLIENYRTTLKFDGKSLISYYIKCTFGIMCPFCTRQCFFAQKPSSS